MQLKFCTAGWVLAAALGIAAFAGGASAAPAPIDPTKVQTLATEIEAALTQLGCTATVQQDIAAIQSTIAASGVSPSEAAAALSIVQTFQGLCGGDTVAVASVNQTIVLALAGGGPAAGPGGAPGGPTPIGPPPVFVGGGGSNYQTP